MHVIQKKVIAKKVNVNMAECHNHIICSTMLQEGSENVSINKEVDI